MEHILQQTSKKYTRLNIYMHQPTFFNMTTTVTPLPDFFSHLLQDHKVDPSNIRLISDNARSQMVPSLLRGSSSSDDATTTKRQFKAVNRWKHDAGYDSDSPLMVMLLAGGRRMISLEPPLVQQQLPSKTSNCGNNKMVRFFDDHDDGFDHFSDDKWSKSSSDSSLSIPKRKSSLTQNCLDEDGKQDAGEGGVGGGRGKFPAGATKGTARKTSSIERAILLASPMSSKSSPTHFIAAPTSPSSPLNTKNGSMRRQTQQEDLDCTTLSLTPSTTTDSASIITPATIPLRSNSHDSSSNTTKIPAASTRKGLGDSMDTAMTTIIPCITTLTYQAPNNHMTALLPHHPGQTTKPSIVTVTPPSTPRIKKKRKTKSSSSSPEARPTRSGKSGSRSSKSSSSSTAPRITATSTTTTTPKYRIPSLGYMISS
jgi:hypothetical protein